MADRGPIVRGPTRGGRGRPILPDRTRPDTVVVIRDSDGLGDIPTYEGPDNRGGRSTEGRRLTGNAGSRRELTVVAAQGCVPVILGGPLPVGGYVIFQKQGGGYLWVDFAVCEGPLEAVGAISNIKFGDKTAAAVGATTEIHLGVAGDTTSTLISTVEPSYTIPEYIAHVVVRFHWPDQDTGEFNPFDFRCDVKGLSATNLVGGGRAFTTNPVRLAHELLINTRWGGGFDASTYFVTSEWSVGQDACDYDIDPGAGTTKRWEISLRLDQQDSLQSWVDLILDHCNGHLRHDGEKYGLWLDLPRAVAQAGGADIKFKDFGTDANLHSKPTVIEKARNEIPTVTIVDYTDAAAEYIDASVQVPEPGPAGDWIEQRFSMRGITTIERARRMAFFRHNLANLGRDFTLEAWLTGALPLEGDRVLLESRRVIPADETPPGVAGATDGVEHIVITDQTVGTTSVTLRGSLYRDGTFSDAIDTSGGPSPPGQTPNTPAAPTNLVLTALTSWENGVPLDRIKIEWTPAAEPYSTFTRITYSRDGVNFFELGTGFHDGPAFLENATLGVQHTFKLYTVRTSTGQISSALTGTITPAAIDTSIPEVIQGQIGGTGFLSFYGPLGGPPGWNHSKPSVAPTVTLNAGGVVPVGTYGVAYSWVNAAGETFVSPRATITVTVGNQILNITAIADGPAGTLFKKVYTTTTNDQNGTLYRRAELAQGSTSTTYNSGAAVDAERAAPSLYDHAAHFAIADNFGSPSEPPVFAVIPFNAPPQKYNPVDCRRIIHEDPSTHNPRIDLIVYVVNSYGSRSTGKSYSNTSVAWPTDLTPLRIKNKGTLVTTRTTVNLVGLGVNASDVGGETQLDLPGGAIFDAVTHSGGASTANEFLLATLTVPAGRLFPHASFLRFTTGFAYKTNGTTPQLTMRIRRNGITGTILFNTGFTTVDMAGASAYFGTINHATTFVTGTVIDSIKPVYELMSVNVNCGTPQIRVLGGTNVITSVDMSASQTFDITGQFDAAGANNLLTLYGAALEILPSN